MKKAILLLLLVPALAYAQKPIKPNLGKVLKFWQENKLADAKAMIDVAETDAKLSLDGKTFYYKGLVYAALDTTSNESFKALAQDPLITALAAFVKADEMAKGKGYFVQDVNGLPTLKEQQLGVLANYYLNKGATAYQEDDFETAIAGFKKTQLVLPKDTTAYFYSGYASYQKEDYKNTVSELQKYLEMGGTSADAYSLIINIYSGALESKEEALAWVTKAKAKYPKNEDFPKIEIGLLIDLNRINKAKTKLEDAVKSEPNNKILHFYLGYVNTKLYENEGKKIDSVITNTKGKADLNVIGGFKGWESRYQEESKVNYSNALKIDPEYFDAQYYLAQIYLIDAEKLKREMNNLGISKEDRAKKLEMDKQLVEKYKTALPYWEKTNALKTEDKATRIEVLDKLRNIYYYLGMDAKEVEIQKQLKTLGAE